MTVEATAGQSAWALPGCDVERSRSQKLVKLAAASGRSAIRVQGDAKSEAQEVQN